MDAATNKKLMQGLFATVARGDRDTFVAQIADDVVMRITGQNSWSRTFSDKASLVRDLYGHLATLLAAGRQTVPHRFIAEGDLVVVEARGRMTTKAGIRYDNDYCLIYRLAEGMIVEITEYCDSALTETVLGPFPNSSGAEP